ncbi:MAG: hypothetical protein UU89_C0003G0015 [Parcubacteria group bacterium GW2011_GWC2_42_11]|nr:MAG: hypothetical protein UU89_C0003G0015 [Parcubacteria group bacterium GW2011_GWC2_42_11]
MFDSPYDLLLKRYPFVLDTVYCSCLISFFQAVKFQEEATRIYVCKIREEDDLERIRDIGSTWRKTQVLHWRGVEYCRDSEEFCELIGCAFRSANLHPEFQNVLLASGHQFLDRIARPSDPLQTVLTKAEAIRHFLEIKSLLVEFNHRTPTNSYSQTSLLQ